MAEEFNAGRRLACGGLVESHIHLDKSRIIDRCTPQERRNLSPIRGVAPLKKTMTIEDVRQRAAQTLEEWIKHGTTRMRTQVEVDLASACADSRRYSPWSRTTDGQSTSRCASSPRKGRTNYPGTDELLVEALKRGAPVIGGAPRYDTNGSAQVERIFALAREFVMDIDMHLDVGDTTAGYGPNRAIRAGRSRRGRPHGQAFSDATRGCCRPCAPSGRYRSRCHSPPGNRSLPYGT